MCAHQCVRCAGIPHFSAADDVISFRAFLLAVRVRAVLGGFLVFHTSSRVGGVMTFAPSRSWFRLFAFAVTVLHASVLFEVLCLRAVRFPVSRNRFSVFSFHTISWCWVTVRNHMLADPGGDSTITVAVSVEQTITITVFVAAAFHMNLSAVTLGFSWHSDFRTAARAEVAFLFQRRTTSRASHLGFTDFDAVFFTSTTVVCCVLSAASAAAVVNFS